MSTIAITGNLPSCVKNMIPCSKYESWVSIDKILEKYESIDPANIDWSTVDRNSWFICIEKNTGKNYSFPIMESENRDNDYMLPKLGMRHFKNKNFDIFQIS